MGQNGAPCTGGYGTCWEALRDGCGGSVVWSSDGAERRAERRTAEAPAVYVLWLWMQLHRSANRCCSVFSLRGGARVGSRGARRQCEKLDMDNVKLAHDFCERVFGPWRGPRYHTNTEGPSQRGTVERGLASDARFEGRGGRGARPLNAHLPRTGGIGEVDAGSCSCLSYGRDAGSLASVAADESELGAFLLPDSLCCVAHEQCAESRSVFCSPGLMKNCSYGVGSVC